MSFRLTSIGTVILCLFAASVSGQEPTIAPELAPPLLPAPPVTAVPEFLPPTVPGPEWSEQSPSTPEVVPPMIVTTPLSTIAPPGIESPPVVLYPRVRVRGGHHAHPQGVPTLVAVADPQHHHRQVHVEVCMPPSKCLNVFHNRRGNRVTYDFGQYEIEIISRLGVVIVDYNS